MNNFNFKDRLDPSFDQSVKDMLCTFEGGFEISYKDEYANWA